MSKQEDFYRSKKPLEKTREIDNEARISKEAEMKRKFNRNQKRITPWDIQLSSLIFLRLQKHHCEKHHWQEHIKNESCKCYLCNNKQKAMFVVVSQSDVHFTFEQPFFARPKNRAPRKKLVHRCVWLCGRAYRI